MNLYWSLRYKDVWTRGYTVRKYPKAFQPKYSLYKINRYRLKWGTGYWKHK